MWNGPWSSRLPWQADNDAALADWARSLRRDVGRRRWRPAVAGSDAHLAGQLGVPHTVGSADGLDPGAILAGLGAGRSWAADTTATELRMHVAAGDRSAGIGEVLVTYGERCTIHLEVGGVPDGVVAVHTDTRVAHGALVPSDGVGSFEWSTTADASFVRVEVRHPDGRMAALTNPVILARGG